jgi:N-acetylglutamate synthase-like GNAT family acetyltransferase
VVETRSVLTEGESGELDRLLWEVLWRPLGFPRDFRQRLGFHGPDIEILARDETSVIGGLVAHTISVEEIEIRHIVVVPEYQGRSVGSLLLKELIGLVRDDAPKRIRTCARDTSAGFFAKAGFVAVGEWLEYEGFAERGIKLREMCLEVM